MPVTETAVKKDRKKMTQAGKEILAGLIVKDIDILRDMRPKRREAIEYLTPKMPPGYKITNGGYNHVLRFMRICGIVLWVPKRTQRPKRPLPEVTTSESLTKMVKDAKLTPDDRIGDLIDVALEQEKKAIGLVTNTQPKPMLESFQDMKEEVPQEEVMQPA